MTTVEVGRAGGLTDAAGRDIGSLAVEEVEGDRLLGTFSRGPDYPTVEPLFRYFEELVDPQCLSLVDEADAAIPAIRRRGVVPSAPRPGPERPVSKLTA